MALEITDCNYKVILAEGKPVVVDFWAPWCGPCKMVAPIFEELAAEIEGQVIIGKCDVDDNSDVAAEYGIRNIPTVLFFKKAFGAIDVTLNFFPLIVIVDGIAIVAAIIPLANPEICTVPV